MEKVCEKCGSSGRIICPRCKGKGEILSRIIIATGDDTEKIEACIL
ncbi:hypothetical protein ISS30_03575 [bacterium]|nr:hypothetical protein [FCB group bacterium]MBL7190752.1 hypothetical protein [bacterium]